MSKKILIVKLGEDEENIKYWKSLSHRQRLANLEKMRQEVIKSKYGNIPGLQRTFRVVKQKQG